MSGEKWKREGLRMKYFVLKPAGNNEHARASRAGMIAYADVIGESAPQFANDIREWVERELVIVEGGDPQ